jgi:hypothetical protein
VSEFQERCCLLVSQIKGVVRQAIEPEVGSTHGLRQVLQHRLKFRYHSLEEVQSKQEHLGRFWHGRSVLAGE